MDTLQIYNAQNREEHHDIPDWSGTPKFYPPARYRFNSCRLEDFMSQGKIHIQSGLHGHHHFLGYSGIEQRKDSPE